MLVGTMRYVLFLEDPAMVALLLLARVMLLVPELLMSDAGGVHSDHLEDTPAFRMVDSTSGHLGSPGNPLPDLVSDPWARHPVT